MADTKLHLQVTIGGGYITSDTADQPEVWQTGFRCVIGHSDFDPVGDIAATYSVVEDVQSGTGSGYTYTSNWRLEGGINDFDPVSYLIDQCRPAALALCDSTALSALAAVWWIKVAPIGVDGKAIPPPGYAQGVPALLSFNSDAYPVGSGSSDILPPQCAVVASHITAQTGRRGKGRNFIPAVDINSVGSGGRLSSGARTSVLNSVVNALEALAFTDIDATYVRPAVISNSGPASAPNLDKYAIISSVRVGDVIDTQRRRRNKLVESYESADVTY